MGPIISLEMAEAKAKSYVENAELLKALGDRAMRKSQHCYGSLLECWENLQIFLRMIRARVEGKYCPPVAAMTMAVAAVLYFVNPIDLIPDSVPVFGYLDDAAVIAAAAKANLTAISNFRKWEELFGREVTPYWKSEARR